MAANTADAREASRGHAVDQRPVSGSSDLSVALGAEAKFLFGGDKSWNVAEWTASDDRVRGGKSVSHLEVLPESSDHASHHHQARFWGNLDPSVLGAGFASQRTVGSKDWDLSALDGVRVVVPNADDKTYTLVLKDEIRDKRPDGREQSSLSFEYEFQGRGTFLIPWHKFVATYRGREVEGKKLDLSSVKRLHIMIRSFFGGQEGDFSLTLESISAVKFERDEKAIAMEAAGIQGKSKKPFDLCGNCNML